MAFLKSIQNGIFFDKKYWARNSKAGDVLKPVYLSSMIMNGEAGELEKCASKFVHWYVEALIVPVVKYLKGRNPLIKDLEGDVNVESDCDEDVVEVKDKLPDTREGEGETRAVLITGSFSAYVHFEI